MKKVLFPLLSGGIDSTLATLKVIQTESKRGISRIIPIFIDYGQKSNRHEWTAVLQTSQRLRKEASTKKIEFCPPVRIKLATRSQNGLAIFKWSQSMLIKGSKSDEPEVENRNMVLIAIAASYAKSLMTPNERALIVTGFRNEFYDTRMEFVNQMNKVFKSLKMHIKIVTPVIKYEGDVGKRNLVELYESKGYGGLINMTWSCYTPVNCHPCKKCPACQKRGKATK